tara:strand:- start:308 stop:484 length:177 start_codon:yes stop_codon:yes gene_type:complete
MGVFEIEGGKDFKKFLNNPEIFKGETPSAFTISNARSLGKLAAFMANKGTLNDQQLMT